jgi:hypothetical protein
VDFVSYCSDFPADKQLLVYRLTRDEVQEELRRLSERRSEFLALVNSTIEKIRG